MHALFLRQEILYQHFLHHKFCTFNSTCVVSLLSKINVQILVTQAIVMQKILMQKMMLQNKPTKIYVDLFLQPQFLCQKFLRKKVSCNNFLSIYFCNGLFYGIYFCKFNKSDYLNKYAKKRCASYDVINIQKFLHIYFCACFFVYLFLCI